MTYNVISKLIHMGIHLMKPKHFCTIITERDISIPSFFQFLTFLQRKNEHLLNKRLEKNWLRYRLNKKTRGL